MKRLKQFAAMLLSAAMVLTSIPVEVFAAADTSILGDTPAEDSTGAYTQYHIYTEADLVSALNGDAAIGGKVTALPAILEKDISLTAPLVVNAEVTLDLNGRTLSADDSFLETEEQKLMLTVEKEKSLTLKGDGTVCLNLVNKGRFFQRGGKLTMKPMYGTTLTNEAGAEAALDEVSFYKPEAAQEERKVIANAGTLTARWVWTYPYSEADPAEIQNLEGGVLNWLGTAGSDSLLLRNHGTLLLKGDVHRVFNEGPAAVAELGEYAHAVYLYSYNGGAVQMNGGEIGILELDEQITISAGSAAPGGTFTMAGGTVNRIYYVSNRPKLIGGTVGSKDWQQYSSNRDAAVLRYEKAADGTCSVSCNTAEYVTLDADGKDVTIPARQHQEGTDAETGKPALVEVPATSIVNGVINDYKDISVAADRIAVSCNAALVEAITNAPADGTLTRIYTKGTPYDTTAVSGNVVVRKGQQIELNLNHNVIFAKDATLTIEEGAAFTVRSEDVKNGFGFSNTENAGTFLTNRGTFGMENCKLNLYNAFQGVVNDGEKAEFTLEKSIINMRTGISSNDVMLVNTKGTMRLQDKAEINMYIPGVMLRNHGTVLMENAKSSAFSENVAGFVCEAGSKTLLTGDTFLGFWNDENFPVYVKNGASFSYLGTGWITYYLTPVSTTPYAIVYEGDSMPVIKGRRIDSFTKAPDGTYGYAVAKRNADGSYESGFIEGANGKTDTRKATVIENGVPRYNVGNFQFNSHYTLLKTGEIYSLSENMEKPLATSYKELELQAVVGNDVVEILNENGEFSVRALKEGYAVVKVYTASLSDDTKVNEVADYMRIEVTDQEVASLTADDYEGVLLEPQLTVNAYRLACSIPYGFHLKSSVETMTGSNAQADAQTCRPVKVYTDDEEFNRYYSIFSWYDREEKNYSFSISPRCGKDGDSPRTIEDGVTLISDIHFYVDLEDENGRTLSRVPLGAMDLRIDRKKPSVKLDAITLNSAYESFTQDNNVRFRSPAGVFVEAVTVEEGLNCNSNNYFAYVGNARTAKLSAKVNYSLSAYEGFYEATVPVNVIYRAPKVALQQRNMSVTSKASEAGKFNIPLFSAVEEDFEKIESIELAENPYYEAIVSTGDTGSDRIGKNYVNRNMLWLNQKKDLDAKGVKLTFTVTYKNLKPDRKGKTVTTKLTLKLKPDKFSVKTSAKNCVLKSIPYEKDYKTTVYDTRSIEILTTPVNFTNGLVRVKAPEDGSLTVSKVRKSENGRYYVDVAANEKTKDCKEKKVVLPVSLCDNAGTEKAAGKITVMIDPLQYTASLKNSVLKMNLDQEAVYDKTDGLFDQDATARAMKVQVPVKLTGKCWETGFTCSDSRFVPVYGLKGYWLAPTPYALKAGLIIPNTRYEMTLTFQDHAGEPYKLPVTVETPALKTVKTVTNTKNVTLYRDTPYADAYIGLKGVRPFNAVIESVTCEDDNFEVYARYKTENYQSNDYDAAYYREDYQIFYIGFKNHTSKGIAARKYKVKLTVQYRNGASGSVTITVNAKDLKKK